jgi:protein-S-isoprenylcysteine O-methyltransferase Ste14
MAAFIVFVISAVSFLLNWWLILLISTVMYALQRKIVYEEDEALRKKFGKTYDEYRENALVKFLEAALLLLYFNDTNHD